MLATEIPSPHSSKHFPIEKSKRNILTGDNVTRFHDIVDSPVIKTLVEESSKLEENICEKMKYECNRLYSFKDNWPVKEITPKNLAAAGFFYLQSEDKVQCPFCYVIILNWTRGDNPLNEHIKKSPKCPFLVGKDVGNIPLFAKKSCAVPANLVKDCQAPSSSTNALYKPQYPRMADIKRRLLTYADWKLNKPTQQELAECGLYYTGVADVVKCFFCGGSLGNWEQDDDVWAEHSKFFPNCAFLSLAKNRYVAVKAIKKKSSLENGLHKFNLISGHQTSDKVNEQPKMSLVNLAHPSSSYSSGIIEEALDIFPKSLVFDALKRLGGTVHSLQQLCDQILELNETSSKSESTSHVSHEISSSVKMEDKSFAANSDTLLCKICMDMQSDVLFQPCGHLVSCSKCAQYIGDCPVCRRPIVNVIKAYLC